MDLLVFVAFVGAVGCASSVEPPRCAPASRPAGAVLEPRDRGFWRRYEIPAWWTDERRSMARALVVGAVGQTLLRHGWVDEVIVDDRARVIDAHANETGHEEIVRDLGGCVLYPEPPCDDCVIAVVTLVRLDARAVARRLVVGGDARMAIDAPTNSLVLWGTERTIHRLVDEARRLDCGGP